MNPQLPPQPAVDQATAQFIATSVDAVQVGHELKFPIYDHHGVLLLSEGAVVTQAFQERLKERQIVGIRVHSEDIHRTPGNGSNRASNADAVAKSDAVAPPEDLEISARMQQTLAEGLQFVTNIGPAASEGRVWHHTNKYQSEKQRKIRSDCVSQKQELSEILSEFKTPDKISSSSLCRLTAGLLENLCLDFDCVTATAMQMQDTSNLTGHSYRMAVLGMSLAMEMGLNEENVNRIGLSGLLHDLGMLLLPRHVREPDAPLNHRDQLELQKHVIYTVNMLERIEKLPALVSIVCYQVHEQMNGTGYPRQRRGQNIHLFARILNVADAYVELTTPRKYREAKTPYEATLVLFEKARRGLIDATVLRAFLRSQSLFPVGSYVRLSDGQLAKVLRSNGDRFTEPIVQLCDGNADSPVAETSNNPPAEEVLDLSTADRRIIEALPMIHGPEPIPAPHFLKQPVTGKSVANQTQPVSQVAQTAQPHDSKATS